MSIFHEKHAADNEQQVTSAAVMCVQVVVSWSGFGELRAACPAEAHEE
jgi:hypothetical protein